MGVEGLVIYPEISAEVFHNLRCKDSETLVESDPVLVRKFGRNLK